MASSMLARVATRGLIAARGNMMRMGVRGLCTLDAMQGDLGHAVAQELGFEKANPEHVTPEALEEALEEAFPDFQVDAHHGNTEFTLSKQYGEETVTVHVNACAPESMDGDDTEHVDLEQEDEEEQEQPVPVDVVSMAVRVSKPDAELDMLFTAAVAMDEAPTVELVSLQMVPPGVSLQDLGEARGYEGPSVADLDTGLQRAMGTFLSDRGLDERFATAVRDMADMKEEGEYLTWLSQVHAFVEGPDVPVVSRPQE